MSGERDSRDRSRATSEATPRDASEPEVAPATTKSSELFGAARMNPVRRERDAAGAQLRHRMKVWRSVGHGAQGQANAQSAPPGAAGHGNAQGASAAPGADAGHADAQGASAAPGGAAQPANAQGGAASSAPPGGGGGGGDAVSCANGRILLQTVLDPNPAPNTSHPQSWLQSHGSGQGLSESNLVGFTEERPSWHASQSAGQVHITLRVHLPAMYIASELTRYPGAVEAVARHEAGHRALWQEALRSSAGFLRTDFDTRILGAVNPGEVNSIMAAQMTQLTLNLRQAGDQWDRQDYPRLHQELRALGVPEGLGHAAPPGGSSSGAGGTGGARRPPRH
jgi:hypothetical protein